MLKTWKDNLYIKEWKNEEKMKLKYKWDNRKNDQWNVNRIFEMKGGIDSEATMKWKTRNGKKLWEKKKYSN